MAKSPKQKLTAAAKKKESKLPSTIAESEKKEQATQRERADDIREDDPIDDPVRMYLMQMGRIPLLTRVEEVDSAKKIESTRTRFRKRDVVQRLHVADGRRDVGTGL